MNSAEAKSLVLESVNIEYAGHREYYLTTFWCAGLDDIGVERLRGFEHAKEITVATIPAPEESARAFLERLRECIQQAAEEASRNPADTVGFNGGAARALREIVDIVTDFLEGKRAAELAEGGQTPGPAGNSGDSA